MDDMLKDIPGYTIGCLMGMEDEMARPTDPFDGDLEEGPIGAMDAVESLDQGDFLPDAHVCWTQYTPVDELDDMIRRMSNADLKRALAELEKNEYRKCD